MTALAFSRPTIYRGKRLRLADARIAKEEMRALLRRELFTDVRQLVSQGLSRKALTRIYDYLDDQILDERFIEVDRVLREVDPGALDATCLLGFLSITLQARERLQEWEPLLSRARDQCRRRGMDEDKIERLFGDLR